MLYSKKVKLQDKLFKGAFLLCAFFSVTALAVISVFLFANGLPFIFKTGVGNFLFGTSWHPLGEPPSYGILPMIAGSVYVTAFSVVIGATIGLFTSICLYKFIPEKAVAPIMHLINLLAGIPSVIFGLIGMTYIVPFVREYISPTGVGEGIFSTSIVLAVMILPTIVSVSLNSLKSVPKEYFEGALALGATKEQAAFTVMLPAAKSGVLSGVVLAIGRAIGETMAVIMVIGGSPEMPESIFQSVMTMTSNIAMGAMELTGDALTALISTGVVLFVFTLLLNLSFSFLKDKDVYKKERK